MTEDVSIKDLLPDYVNGLLSEEDARRVEEAARADRETAADIAFYRNVKAAVQSGADDFTPGAFGWARLSRAIDGEARAPSRAPARSAASPLWRYAAAALAVVALGQFALLATSGAPAPGDARYLTASDAGAAVDHVGGHMVRVAFAGDARQEAITALLQSVDGEIAGGPGALGLFLVRFEDEAAQAAALEAFANNPDLVESAARDNSR